MGTLGLWHQGLLLGKGFGGFSFSLQKNKKPKVNPKGILYSGISNESSIKVKEYFKNREYGFSRPLGSSFIKIRSICLDMRDINSVL